MQEQCHSSLVTDFKSIDIQISIFIIMILLKLNFLWSWLEQNILILIWQNIVDSDPTWYFQLSSHRGVVASLSKRIAVETSPVVDTMQSIHRMWPLESKQLVWYSWKSFCLFLWILVHKCTLLILGHWYIRMGQGEMGEHEGF